MSKLFLIAFQQSYLVIVCFVWAAVLTAIAPEAHGDGVRDIEFAGETAAASDAGARGAFVPPAQIPRGSLGDLATHYPEVASREVIRTTPRHKKPVVLQRRESVQPLPPSPSQAVQLPVVETVESSIDSSCAEFYPRAYCDTLGPCSPCAVHGFHCIGPAGCPCDRHGRRGWEGAGPIPWQVFAHGEYIGPARLPHVPEYYLRVDDRLDFVFRLTRVASDQEYQLEVGDQLRISSLTAPEVNTEVLVQPDGRIILPRLGPVVATGLTLIELQQVLSDAFRETGIRDPQVTVTPLSINTRLEELRATVDNRYGAGGQSRLVRVTPEGTIQLPAIGTVFVQGFTLPELKREIDLRYSEIVSGLEVTPILDERAPRFCYVVGEVRIPGRYELVAPTTIIQAISLAGSWNVGAKLEHVVVFRRDENWNLMATKVNLRPALFGKSPCPAGEIWLRDSDIVIVPKSCLLTTTDAIDLIFTRGVYAVFPFNATLQLNRLNTIP